MTNTLTNNGTFRICKEVKVDYRSFILNLLSDGLHYFGDYGFIIDFDSDVYDKTKEVLLKSTTKTSSKHPNVQVITLCYEDILTQMILDGGEIIFTDEECGGEYTAALTLDKVEKALWRFLEEEPSDAFIMGVERIIEEEYDADDCDNILQHILFGECMFS